MKKLIFIFAAALVTSSFCSCSKGYDCKCTDSTGYVWSESTIHGTKKKATDECTANSTGATITCKIQ